MTDLPSDVTRGSDGRLYWRNRPLTGAPEVDYAAFAKPAAPMPFAKPRDEATGAPMNLLPQAASTPQRASSRPQVRTSSAPIPAPRSLASPAVDIPPPRVLTPTDIAPAIDPSGSAPVGANVSPFRVPIPNNVAPTESTVAAPSAAPEPQNSSAYWDWARTRPTESAPVRTDAGALPASANAATDAATFGLADPLIAGVLTVPGMAVRAYRGQDWSPGATYGAVRQDMANLDAAQREAHPVSSVIGSALGGLASVGAARQPTGPVNVLSAEQQALRLPASPPRASASPGYAPSPGYTPPSGYAPPAPTGGVPAVRGSAPSTTSPQSAATTGSSVPARRVYDGETLRGQPATARTSGSLEGPVVEGTVNRARIPASELQAVEDGSGARSFVRQSELGQTGRLQRYSANGRPVTAEGKATVDRTSVSPASETASATRVPHSQLKEVSLTTGQRVYVRSSDLRGSRVRDLEIFDANGKPTQLFGRGSVSRARVKN